jgi:hypothetical protein
VAGDGVADEKGDDGIAELSTPLEALSSLGAGKFPETHFLFEGDLPEWKISLPPTSVC